VSISKHNLCRDDVELGWVVRVGETRNRDRQTETDTEYQGDKIRCDSKREAETGTEGTDELACTDKRTTREITDTENQELYRAKKRLEEQRKQQGRWRDGKRRAVYK
jgi:hypothetical protein